MILHRECFDNQICNIVRAVPPATNNGDRNPRGDRPDHLCPSIESSSPRLRLSSSSSASISPTAVSANCATPPRSYAAARRDWAAGQSHPDLSTIAAGAALVGGDGPSGDSNVGGHGHGGGGDFWAVSSPETQWMREVRRGHLLTIVKRMVDANSCVWDDRDDSTAK